MKTIGDRTDDDIEVEFVPFSLEVTPHKDVIVISFAHDMYLLVAAAVKTATARKTGAIWAMHPGDLFLAKDASKILSFMVCRCTHVSTGPVSCITEETAQREGFSCRDAFMRYWQMNLGGHWNDEVHFVSFEVLK